MSGPRDKAAVIRADGSLALGHGHVFRTLVLAEELAKRGWKVCYVSRDLAGAPLSRIRDAGHDLVLLGADIDEGADAKKTARATAETGATWVVVDRYATGEKAHALWRARGLKVLAIDDICEHRFDVDILLNQNTDAEELPYVTREDTVSLLGPRYALVRESYRKARPAAPRKIDRVKNVLLFMGGSDPNDATSKVLRALNGLGASLEVEVVLGAAYPHFDKLCALAGESPHRVEVHRDLPDLVGPMSRADVAIAAGGSVVWELCCMGVPILLWLVADNQCGNACWLANNGSVRILGDSRGIEKPGLERVLDECFGDLESLSALAKASWIMLDGYGSIHVVETLLSKGRGLANEVFSRHAR